MNLMIFGPIISMLLLFLWAYIDVENEKSIGRQVPNYLVSIGIMFTFIGISIALYNFDTININKSIPQLLDGLKLAFLSSIAGLVLSTLLKIRIHKHDISNESNEDLSASDFLKAINKINTGISSGFEGLKKAISGDSDSSLSTLLSKLRNDFRDFAEKVTEDGSQKLIEALENVISDFNNKITEQFGDNFKQLNIAVGKLLEWQQEYKDQVEVLTDNFKKTGEKVETITKNIEKIVTDTALIPENIKDITLIHKNAQVLIAEINDGLSSLAAMKENAVNAVPEIQEQIKLITKGIEDASKNQLNAIENISQKTNDAISTNANSLTEANESFKESAKKIETLINNSIDEVNSKLHEQLNSSLGVMGNNLSSITEKFVEICEDHYGQLVKIRRDQ